MPTPRHYEDERDEAIHERESRRGTSDSVNPGAGGMERDERERLLEMDRLMRETLSSTIRGRTHPKAAKAFNVTALGAATRGVDGIAKGVRVRVTIGGHAAGQVEVTFMVSDGTIAERGRHGRARAARTRTVKTDARGVAELVGWKPDSDSSTAIAFFGNPVEITFAPAASDDSD